LAKKAYSALGLKVFYLFNKPDGRFPYHHPDPTLESNLFYLKKLIQEKNLDFGFGFDGDGDRLVLVKNKGKTLFGDELGFLFLKSLASQKKRTLILADVKCSDWFFEAVKKQGFRVLMTKSGHGLMRSQMEKTKARLGVELSGHIFFNDRKNQSYDDALYASLRFLELLETQTLSSLLPQASHVQTKEIRIEMSKKDILQKLSKLKSYLKRNNESFKSLDGLRLSRKKSWALFRASKTQESLSLRFGAKNKAQLLQIKKEFSKVIDLKIP